MKRFNRLVLLPAIVALAAVASLSAAELTERKPIRILLTTGGHGFEAEPFYGMFDAMDNVQYTKAELPKDAGLLKPGLEKKFDCIVMYDMVGGITPEQQKAFVALLKTGIGVVSLHHNLGAHRDWDEFRKIIGGKFILVDAEIDGKPFKKTPWSHDEDLKITVVDKKHPITRGVDDFEIHDETYGVYYTAPGIKVLLKTDHPKNNPELAWTTSYGKSRVFFLMLGHDGKAYAHPSLGKLIAQGICWAAGR
ncbi:MAG: ThuA domain-containing protein [Planctomycetes bacterium]|nr:ThuA domain-containing protein [Planctomycetota bacterium]